jgi:hypothetical protein
MRPVNEFGVAIPRASMHVLQMPISPPCRPTFRSMTSAL